MKIFAIYFVLFNTLFIHCFKFAHVNYLFITSIHAVIKFNNKELTMEDVFVSQLVR